MTIGEAAKATGIPLEGVSRHIYLDGPPRHKDPRKFIAQLALPIAGPRDE